MNHQSDRPILLTGATGFIGSHLYPRLVDRGFRVRCATRSVQAARERHPERTWVEFDVERPETLAPALEGCRAAYYLVHQMAGGAEFEARERRAAHAFAQAASEAGLERLVYLGGVEPDGPPSEHLESRLRTGWILRGGGVTTVELRASMILGPGSASWQIVRDLAARLPIMLLPAWTQSRTEPLYIGDAVDALLSALTMSVDESRWFDIPGPERLTIEQILQRTARQMGHRTRRVRLPLVSPKLSSYWLHFLTSADYAVAHALVEGLKGDLLAHDDTFWSLADHRQRVGFDEAVRRTLAQETPPSPAIRAVERLIGAVSGRGGTPAP